jgi:SAM-dependent methyltransferase
VEPTIEVAAGNAGQLRDWDGSHGEYWAAQAESYDAGVARYQPALLAAAALTAGERALDVGCGSGKVAIDLVAAAPDSAAIGVDLSSAQLEVARRRAGDLPVTFLHADAQVHPFEPESFDLVVSRTGSMFFADPAAAFANLARATRPGGRLVMLVWRSLADNEWLREFLGAIAQVRSLPAPPPDAPGPFALSDPDRVRPLLEENGWGQVDFAALDEPMWFGLDPDTATAFIVGQMEWALAPLTPEAQAQATANLHEVMARHAGDGGVWLDSGAWLVTARRTG